MGSDPRLMALPALRKRAEEEARDLFVARYTDAARGLRDWAEDDNERELCIRAHLTLLCDLTRPASRWELAALIGARLGWEPVDVLQAIQNGGLGWIDLCKDAHVDAAELECGADDEALTLIALAVLGGAS